MNRKRDRSPSLSPSGSGDESTKVCLICEAIPHEDVKSSYYVFVLDPAEASADAETDSFPNREPTLRIDGLGTVTFCVFKSTLYIFEFEFISPVEKYERDYQHRLYKGSDKDIEVDYDIEADYHMDAIALLCQRKSVYSFDLPDSSSSEMIIVQKSDLHKLPDMHGVKVVAEAVVTPGGKILVFSTIITTDVYYYPHLIAPFELYDPDTKEWIKIPEVAQEFEEDMCIWGAGFLSSSTFLISCGNGNFVFDLDKNGSGWNQHNLLPTKMEGFKFVGVAGGEGVCLTSSDRLKNARDWTTLSMNPQNRSRFPRYLLDSFLGSENIGFFPRLSREPLFCVVDTADADGCFNFCGARVLIFRDSKSCPTCGARVLNFRDSKSCPASLPYFIFDVFRGRPGDELELSGSIKFCSNIGDFFDLKFWGLFRVCFNC